jgi:hypothetical protein
VKLQARENEPYRDVVDESEIDAIPQKRLSKGYWASAVEHADLLPPHKALRLFFQAGRLPRGVEASIHSAAAEAGIPVSVHVRGAIVYVRKTGERTKRRAPVTVENTTAEERCKVCNKSVAKKPGVYKQVVCSGNGKEKSDCQKIWRYKQAHPGMTVEEAKVHYHRRHRKRTNEPEHIKP